MEIIRFPLRLDLTPNHKGAPRIIDSAGRVIAYGTGFYGGEIRQLTAFLDAANAATEAGRNQPTGVDHA